MSDFERLLTSEDVALLLGISVREVRAKAREGALPCYRVGGRLLRFDRNEVSLALRGGHV